MIKHLEEIVEAAKRGPKRRLVAAYAQDSHTIEAVNDAVELGFIEGVLVGDKDVIEAVCAEHGIDPAKFEIIDIKEDVDCVAKAVKMVHDGEGDILMKGLVSSDKYVRGILNKEYGLLIPGGVLSHVAIFDTPKYHKLILVSDAAIIPAPTFEQKEWEVRYLAEVAQVLGVEQPKIACIAPSEQLLPKIVSSAESYQIHTNAAEGKYGNVLVEGPLSIDVALYPEVVATKKYKTNGVAGDADCLLFPSIEAGNTFFKLATHWCDARLAALVKGTTKPCILTSRGDSRDSKLASIALAAISVK
ncbi:MAG: phosphate butyryltransferase [Rikenellaceae bacterium]|jgi:phosphate butyryltransferase|nr:phosphate butyryltransferase [Rikenellaceae bacterium]